MVENTGQLGTNRKSDRYRRTCLTSLVFLLVILGLTILVVVVLGWLISSRLTSRSPEILRVRQIGNQIVIVSNGGSAQKLDVLANKTVVATTVVLDDNTADVTLDLSNLGVMETNRVVFRLRVAPNPQESSGMQESNDVEVILMPTATLVPPPTPVPTPVAPVRIVPIVSFQAAGIEIGGAGAPGYLIQIMGAGTEPITTTVGDDGMWKAVLPNLVPGEYEVAISQFAPRGVEAAASAVLQAPLVIPTPSPLSLRATIIGTGRYVVRSGPATGTTTETGQRVSPGDLVELIARNEISDWVKIRVLVGSDKDAVGWIKTEALGQELLTVVDARLDTLPLEMPDAP